MLAVFCTTAKNIDIVQTNNILNSLDLLLMHSSNSPISPLNASVKYINNCTGKKNLLSIAPGMIAITGRSIKNKYIHQKSSAFFLNDLKLVFYLY